MNRRTVIYDQDRSSREQYPRDHVNHVVPFEQKYGNYQQHVVQD